MRRMSLLVSVWGCACVRVGQSRGEDEDEPVGECVGVCMCEGGTVKARG